MTEKQDIQEDSKLSIAVDIDSSVHLWLRHEVKLGEERAPITPKDAKKLINAGFKISVERSPTRCIKAEEYEAVGCSLVEQESWPSAPADAIIFGLKELPENDDPLTHRHIMFAHVYKNQSGWKKTLSRWVKGNGLLWDLEFLHDDKGRRVAAFGRAAGIAGMALGLKHWCLRQFDKALEPLKSWSSLEAAIVDVKGKLQEVKKLKGADKVPTALVLGALGRCGDGACWFAEQVGVQPVKWDLEETKAGGPFKQLLAFDILLNAIYLNKKIPPFLTAEMVEEKGRKLSVIVDVSCDTSNPNNPLPMCTKNTTLSSPVLRIVESEIPLDIITIDHLPSLIPCDSSAEFSSALTPTLLELTDTKYPVWKRCEELFYKKCSVIGNKEWIPLQNDQILQIPLQNDLILRAARGQPTDRVPVWIHRQAGRYLPEYREERKHVDFFTLCRTPELVVKVTLQPLARFPLDAAIIFCDILVIPQALGLEVLMVPGKGPVFPNPLKDPSDLQRLNVNVNINSSLGYVFDAISLTRKALAGRVPLIGFAGAPWTLMAYMVQGGSSKTKWKAKLWLYKYPNATHKVLKILTDTIIEFLIKQVQAGAQLLQIFESNGGDLTPELFKIFALPYLTKIVRNVKRGLASRGLDIVPMTIFPRGANYALELLANSGYDVISLDWTIDPQEARARVGKKVTLQGNFDSSILFGETDVIRVETEKMVKAFGTQRYIANLGHGMIPQHDPASVATFVDAVHSISDEINTETPRVQLDSGIHGLPLFVKKLSAHAILPTRGSDCAAGYDLSSAYDIIIPAEGKGIIKTDLAIALPTGTYGRVAPRSGLSWKKHTDVGAGVIDEDYRGNVGVVLFNHSKEDLHIKCGDRVAQLIVEAIAHPRLVQVDSLDSTKRGSGGFGSTGMSRNLDQRKQVEHSMVKKETQKIIKKQKSQQEKKDTLVTILEQLFVSPVAPSSVTACIDAAITIGDRARTDEGRNQLTCDPKNEQGSTKSRTLIQILCKILFLTENSNLKPKSLLALKEKVVRAIGNLCYEHDSNRFIITEFDGIRGLVDLGNQSSDLAILRNVCGALGNLSEGKKLQTMLVDAGGVGIWVKSLELSISIMSKRSDTSAEMLCHMALMGFGRMPSLASTDKSAISFINILIRIGNVIKTSSKPNDQLLTKVVQVLFEFAQEKMKALVDGEAVPFLMSLLHSVGRDISEIQVECIKILCRLIPKCSPSMILSIASIFLDLLDPLTSSNIQIEVLFPSKSVKHEALGALATLAAEPHISETLLCNGLPSIINCIQSEDKIMRSKALTIIQVLAKEDNCDRLFGNSKVKNILIEALQHVDMGTKNYALSIFRNLSLRSSLKLPIANCALDLILGLLVGSSDIKQPTDGSSNPTECMPMPSAIPIVRNLLSIPRNYETKEEEIKFDAMKKKIANYVVAYANGIALTNLTQLAETGESAREKNIRFEAGRTVCMLCQAESSREFFWGVNSSAKRIKNVFLLMIQLIQTKYMILWLEASRALMYLTNNHIKSFSNIATQDIKEIEKKKQGQKRRKR